MLTLMLMLMLVIVIESLLGDSITSMSMITSCPSFLRH
jgi:hypothetical protein